MSDVTGAETPGEAGTPGEADPPAEADTPGEADPPAEEVVSPAFATVLGPWPAHRRRRARIVLILLVILPVGGVVLSLNVVSDTPEVLLSTSGRLSRGSGLRTLITLDAVDPQSATVRASLSFVPVGDLAGVSGVTRSIRIVVLGSTESGRFDSPAGQPMQTISARLRLNGSRATRYPLDRYRVDLSVIAVDGVDLETPIPLETQLFANNSDFHISAAKVTGNAGSATFAVDVARGGAVLTWALVMALVFWILGLGAASLAWLILVDSRPIPPWAWGFFAGMLFALPSLRVSLPGDPPLGSLIDWGSFFWALALVVVSLTTIIVLWNIRARGPDPLGSG